MKLSFRVITMLAVASFLVSTTPRAYGMLLGVHLEPFVGYQIKGDATITAGGQSVEYDYTGYQYGARAGLSAMMLDVGLEYSMGDGELEYQGSKEDAATSTLGIFINYDFPILVRVFGTYFIQDQNETTDDASVKSTWKGAGGFRLGVGFKPLPLVSVNLEYINNTFDEVEQSGVTVTDGVDLDVKTYMISVSVPLGL